MMLYEDIKSVVDGDTSLPLVLFLFVIIFRLRSLNFTQKLNDMGCILSERRSNRHPALKITGVDYADMSLIIDTTTGTPNLLYSLENTVQDVGLYVNAGKTKPSLPNNLQRNPFRTIVESVLLYGTTAGTLTKATAVKLDRTCTRMQRVSLLQFHTHKYCSWCLLLHAFECSIYFLSVCCA